MSPFEIMQKTELAPGELAICWLGQAGFLMKDHAGNTLVVDPYLTNCGYTMRGFKRLSPMLIDPEELVVDYYLISHQHFDHFDYEAIPVIAKNAPNTKFFGPDCCLEQMKLLGLDEVQFHLLNRGDVFGDDVVQIEAITADHGTMAPDAIGFLLEMGGHRMYFSGDTCFHQELCEKAAAFRPDVSVLSINGRFGNMTAEDGIQAAKLIGAKYSIPCHFWTFAEHGGSPDLFFDGLKDTQVQALPFWQGEIQVLDAANNIR